MLIHNLFDEAACGVGCCWCRAALVSSQFAKCSIATRGYLLRLEEVTNCVKLREMEPELEYFAEILKVY